MTGTHAARSRSRLALLALFVTAPLVAATIGGVAWARPAAAATSAQVLHLMDVNGASVAEHSGHGQDRHDDGADRGDRSDRHHDDDRGDRGARCYNCGWGNGGGGCTGNCGGYAGGDRGGSDSRGGERDHRGGGDGDRHGGDDDRHGGGCAPKRESLLEALLDGLCTGGEELERALTGAR